MQAPNEVHFKAAKSVLRYLCSTTDYGIMYKKDCEVKLLGFIDSAWAEYKVVATALSQAI